MRPSLNFNWKLTAAFSLTLPLVMVLFRVLWPEISWGFLLLFGLQVMLLLAALHVVFTCVWGPGSRWDLPSQVVDSKRRIFLKKGAPMARVQALLQSIKETVLAGLGRLRLRKAT
ncbi:MAG: hypothetical protein ACK5BY_00410 [Limnohabitans sp.]|jgi:hypothetical protein|uniref:hypothetical protein n=1 Tax=Limnohabitans sp. TaxID=1907725 RepID=UPI00391A71C3